MPTLRCLTASGIAAFAEDLEAMRNPALLAPTPAPRADLLHDPRYSESFPLGNVEVEQRHFANRREFALYIDARFQAAGIAHDVDVPGMWEWLTVFYFAELSTVGLDGRPDVKRDLGRYVIKAGGRGRQHRHLLRDPYWLFRAFRDSPRGEADVVLNQPLHEPGDIVESICARERLRTSPAVMRVARTLFYDDGKDQSNPITRGEGGLRDYCKFVQNLPTEFNLTEIAEHTLLALLPDQFDPLIQAAGAIDEITDIRSEFGSHIIQPTDAESQEQSATLDVIGIADTLKRVSGRTYSQHTVAVRNDNFRAAVIGSYENRCGISGIGLVHDPEHRSPQYEVQAAHIIPVAAGGRDTVDNGLALNRSIHWAFDLGMIWIATEDQLRTRVSEEVRGDQRNEWLRTFNGRPLNVPTDQRLQPSIEAIKWHAQNVAMR